MNDIITILYALFTLLIAISFAVNSRSEYKFITFLIVFWIFAHTKLGTQTFILPITEGFEIQPARMLFLLLSIYFIYLNLSKNNLNNKLFLFEKFLLLYFLLSLIVLLYHTGNVISIKDSVVIYTGLLTFLLVYFVLKYVCDEGMLDTIYKAIILLAFISTIVAIIQFTILPEFSRFDFKRVAFGGLLRSNGITRDEYINSYILIIAIIVSLILIKNKFFKYTLIGLFSLGVILSFHRMSWITSIVILGTYYIFIYKKYNPILKFSFVVLLIFITWNVGGLLTIPIFNEFVYFRLMEDTATGRLNFYLVALSRIPDYWLFGVGSALSNVYYADALMSGETYAATGEMGGIHNLYINIAYFYGIPVMISFILFLILIGKFFFKRMKYVKKYYFIPFGVWLLYLIANLTNCFYISSEISILIGIILGISVSAYEKKFNVIT